MNGTRRSVSRVGPSAEERWQRLVDALGWPVNESGQAYGPCPVHGGDKASAFSVGVGEDGWPGLTCYTGCKDEITKDRSAWYAKARRRLVAAGVPADCLAPARGAGSRSTRPTPRTARRTPRQRVAAAPPDPDYLERCSWAITEDRTERLAADRGLTVETIEAADIGWDEKTSRYVLPVYDLRTKDLVDLQTYKIGSHLHHRSGGTARLYSPDGFDRRRAVLVCEGAWDVLAARQHGLNAIGVTGGAGAVPVDLSALQGCEAAIVFDCDKEGRAGAAKLSKALVPIARAVKVVDLGLPDDGGDIRDWFVTHGRTAEALMAVVDKPELLDAESEDEEERKERLREKVDELWLVHEAKAQFQSELAIRRQATSTKPRRVSGDEFFLDIPKDPPVLWGDGSRIFWVDGEPMLICGDDGVGKSTLAHQLIAMRLGLLPTEQLFGYTVAEAQGRILYLAMDRPEQARRAGGRLFPKLYGDEKFREVLNERLVVWRGPLPVDPLSSPDALADWLRNEFGSDLSEVHADSLKDIAPRLTDDSVGSGLNTAIQEVISRGVNWVGLHHQRKANGENKRPEQLSDVYGSRWITAGHGSVLMLIKASDENKDYVELRQLKEPMDRIPAMLLKHDRATGRTHEVVASQDPELILNEFGDEGVTVNKAASLMFKKPESELTDALKKKAERSLKRFVELGKARYQSGTKGGAGGSTPGRYVRIEGA